jgi:diguanylate cyclase (GGDEF)-like protein
VGIIESGTAEGLLKATELLSPMSGADLAFAVSKSEPIDLRTGEVLFGAGSRAASFCVVRSGLVAVKRGDAELARFGPGDAVGDFDFARGGTRDADAVAVEPSSILRFPAREASLDELALEGPRFVSRLLVRCIAMISARLRSANSLVSENAPWVREIRRQAYTDGPTGLLNRAFIDEELPSQVEDPSALILLKPDRFKDLNDAYGHQAGDAAMSRVARLLKDEAEALGRGWAVRIKSNETALVVPRCGLGEGRQVAARLAGALARVDISDAISGASFDFTASQSLAVWPEDGAEFGPLFQEAYKVLMEAWAAGGAQLLVVRERRSSVAPGAGVLASPPPGPTGKPGGGS